MDTETNKNRELAISWEKELAEQYQLDAARAPEVGDRWLKIKDKKLVLDDLSAAELRIVILDYVHEHAYYVDSYNPSRKQSPVCWALNADARELHPGNVLQKQSETCYTCDKNKYRSAPSGRGKACKNSIRLALLVLEADGGDGFLGFLRVPPASLVNFAAFADKVLRMAKLPLAGVSVTVGFDKAATFEKLRFSDWRKVDNPALISTIRSYGFGPQTEIRSKLLRGFEAEAGAAEDERGIDDMLLADPITEADEETPF